VGNDGTRSPTAGCSPGREAGPRGALGLGYVAIRKGLHGVYAQWGDPARADPPPRCRAPAATYFIARSAFSSR
jgi:hypothetical protein